MNENLTDITIVLDRSGSMEEVRSATIEGFNTFLRKQREATVGAAVVSLVQFDDQYEPNYTAIPVDQAAYLSMETFQPRASTALLDAIGRTIDGTGKRLASMPAATRPAKVLFVIITDGRENASQRYRREQINKMISHQRDTYSWDFIFLGANQDAFATGAEIGLNFGKTMTYAHNAMGTANAFAATAQYAMRSRGMSAGQAVFDNAFTQEDRDTQTCAGVNSSYNVDPQGKKPEEGSTETL